MKKIIYFLFVLIVSFSSCKQESEDDNTFEIFGQISGDIPDYIFIEYNNVKDSTKITNNHFYFKGQLDHIVRANLYIKPVSSTDASLFIENTKIDLDLVIDRKKYNENIVNFINIKNISGTKTQEIVDNFEDYLQMTRESHDLKNELFDKINDIVQEYPKNPYSVELLYRYSTNNTLNTSQIKSIFNKLDKNNSEKYYMNEVRKIVFPNEKILVGNNFEYFKLPNSNNEFVNTAKFKGKYIFVDFWASWCTPCLKQFPKLKKLINEQFTSDLIMIGVSFDTDKKKWTNAINKYNLPWINLIEENGLKSNLSGIFGITYLPYNLLIDKSGKILAIDIDLEDIKPLLDKQEL